MEDHYGGRTNSAKTVFGEDGMVVDLSDAVALAAREDGMAHQRLFACSEPLAPRAHVNIGVWRDYRGADIELRCNNRGTASFWRISACARRGVTKYISISIKQRSA